MEGHSIHFTPVKRTGGGEPQLYFPSTTRLSLSLFLLSLIKTLNFSIAIIDPSARSLGFCRLRSHILGSDRLELSTPSSSAAAAMVGSGVASSSARGLDVDRFYKSPPVRRQLEQQKKLQQQQQPPPPQAAAPPQRPSRPKPRPSPPAEPESRLDSDDSSSKPSVSSSSSSSSSSPSPLPIPPVGNLDRFLEATTPVVPAQHFPKVLDLFLDSFPLFFTSIFVILEVIV